MHLFSLRKTFCDLLILKLWLACTYLCAQMNCDVLLHVIARFNLTEHIEGNKDRIICFVCHSEYVAVPGRNQTLLRCSLIPRPPLFFVLRFAFSIIQGSALLFPCIILNPNRRTKTGGGLALPCIILDANQRTKNGGGLGTRLTSLCISIALPSLKHCSYVLCKRVKYS